MRIYRIFIILFLLILTGCEGGLDELGLGTGSYKIDDYDEIIAFYANKYKIPVKFINAVIETESAWDKDAVSPAGAEGLMQLMPGTAKMLGVKDSFDPRQNIAGGTKYLRMLLNKFNGNYKLALAAYNAGPRTVEKYKGIPPYEETINYVDRVMSLYKSSQ
ncbi:MAG: lytic transglycosylase domain-containing protein [Candidatus Eremiobacterota bacterium]